MKLLLLGDVVGTPGRLAVQQQAPRLRERHGADLVIVNAENCAGGSGLTPELYAKLVSPGVADGLTLGDHWIKKRQIATVLDRESDIVRPANLPRGAAGRGVMRLRPPGPGGGPEVLVMTVLGRLFMSIPADSPFEAVEAVLATLPEVGSPGRPIVVIEAHCEATSEKEAMGWAFNGRVACVFGTHTHVPTADARILPLHYPGGIDPPDTGPLPPPGAGTAYVSDLGMCGPRDAVLGRRVDRVLRHMTTAMPAPFDVAEGDVWVQGVLIEVDAATGLATRIERVDTPAAMDQPPFVLSR